MELKAFLKYWSLTFAVFTIYLFAFLAAAVDIGMEVAEAIRKKRAAARPGVAAVLRADPLKGKTVAGTIGSPGQRLDPKRRWVFDHVASVLTELGIRARVLVLEDSKHHPFIQVSDGRRMATYRVNREAVEQGRAGDPGKIDHIRDYLRRHLAADFLGEEAQRPPRTTELAREAATKPAPARPTPQSGTTGT